MAWEEESIESGADFEEVGGKKSIVKILIIVVIAAVVIGGGYFAYTKFMASPDEETAEGGEKAGGDGDGEGDAKAEGDGEGEEEGAGEELTEGLPVTLEKFTVNLAGASTHYLVTSVVLEVSDQALKDKLNNTESIYMSRTRSTINQILRSKTYDEMRDPASSMEVAKEIKFKLNRAYKDGKVLNVHFSEFLVD